MAVILSIGLSGKAENSIVRVYRGRPMTLLGLVLTTVILALLNCLIIVALSALIRLHIRLIKYDFTAYEYILYKRDRKDRLRSLKKGDIDQADFDYEEERALDQGVKKRSKIIREIKQEERDKARANR